MRCLKKDIMIDIGDYDRVFAREACRAIIQYEGKYAFIRSEKHGEYRFPGGGVQKGENYVSCLIREVLEETGIIIEKPILLGYYLEQRRSRNDSSEVFRQKSVYFRATILEFTTKVKLDKYERELGYHLVFEDIDEALLVNQRLLSNTETDFSFEKDKSLKRDTEIMYMIKEKSL